MLRKAKARVAARRLSNVDGLAVMDAQHLGFKDAAFDVVVAQYVITTVPDAERTLDEFARVVKPGGEIVLVNHLGAESGLRAACERGFAPLARRLGWHPEFGWERLARWAARHGGVQVDGAAADAAARTFFADPFRAHRRRRRLIGSGGVQPRRSASQWPEHADVEECPVHRPPPESPDSSPVPLARSPPALTLTLTWPRVST